MKQETLDNCAMAVMQLADKIKDKESVLAKELSELKSVTKTYKRYYKISLLAFEAQKDIKDE